MKESRAQKIQSEIKIWHWNNRILTRNIIYSHLSHKFIFNFAQFAFTTSQANIIAQVLLRRFQMLYKASTLANIGGLILQKGNN